MAKKTVTEAVWEGEYWGTDGAIARARRQYEVARTYRTEEVSEELLSKQFTYMNALYSALSSIIPTAKRGNPIAIFRSLYLVLTLRPFYEGLFDGERNGPLCSDLTSDQEEMLAAQLAAFSTIPVFGESWHAAAARTFAESALSATEDDEQSHTAALAALTLAKLDLAEKENVWGDARDHILFAQVRAGHVQDPNQKARILRSCALLWVELDFREKAVSLLNEALAVPGVAAGVREKLVEAKRSMLSS